MTIHKKLLSLVCVLSMLLTLGAAGLAETTPAEEAAAVQRMIEGIDFFKSGDGTAENPYQIDTADQFVAFASLVNDGSQMGFMGQYIQLASDIDLSDVAWTPIGNMNDMENHSTLFLGHFDGAGHTVSNLTFAAEEPLVGAGLFGLNAGTVQNLIVENTTVTAETSMAVGGAIGYNMGLVDHVTAKNVIVSGTNCVGGLIGGSAGGTVTNCVADAVTVNVMGNNDFSQGLIQADVAECGGLLIGGGFGGTVDNCTANGTVKAEGNEPVGLGGIGGCLEMMDAVTNCTAEVVIESAQGGHAIGGLCGYAGTHSNADVALNSEGFSTTNYPAIIDGCNVTLTVNAPSATHVGGLIGTGLYYYGEETAFAVTNCTVKGELNGAVGAGALAGRAVGSSFENCTAEVTADDTTLTEAVGTTACLYESADQSEEQAAAAAQMNAMSGTYQPLFEGATFGADCDAYWHDAAAAVVGESGADMAVAMMKASIGSTIYGKEAMEAYADNPDAMAFFCGFTGDVATFRFDGTQISGYAADGTQVFSHAYGCIGNAYIGEEMGVTGFGGALWQSIDADAGAFTYFLLLPDTKDTTYHIEFRYGDDLDSLKQYATGKYAYWLAAGISTDAMNEKSDHAAQNDAMLRNVIALFSAENLAEMVNEETAAQRADLVGTWDASQETLAVLRAAGNLPNAAMYCVLNADGTGATYVDIEGTGDFVQTAGYTFYACDNDGNEATQSGVYIVMDEETAHASLYSITEVDGRRVLTLAAEDGTAVWVQRAAE